MEENSIKRGAERAFWPGEGEIRGPGMGPAGAQRDWELSDGRGQRVRVGTEELLALAERALAGGALPEHERRAQECRAFLERFPEEAARLSAGEKAVVPREVWRRVRAGESLAGAYGDYLLRSQLARRERELDELRQELDALRQERENAARSTGRVRSAGEGEVFDPVAVGWNSV